MPTFDDYFSRVPEPERAALERVCQHVRRAVPGVEEGESYGMPAFRYRGRPLLGFRASKHHLSVFPLSPQAIDAARDYLAGFAVSKGTVHFIAARPLPDAALDGLVSHRVREIEGG